MCGILGVLSASGVFDAERFFRASTKIGHRGPDDDGWLEWNSVRIARGKGRPASHAANVVFGHRRLSILDLSQSGWQPMCTQDEMQAISFNGEIYNYVELKKELEAQGIVFQSTSDTEVLLKGLELWGTDVLNRLTGMFAFAHLDLKRKKVILARDFFGIKPLYYMRIEDGWVFSSEIKSVMEFLKSSARLNADYVFPFLRFGHTDSGTNTMIKSIMQVASGSYLEFDLATLNAEPAIKKYWTLAPKEVSERSFESAAEKVREIFLENVRLHLRSDVPVGAALSGGIDSSAIVMAMRHIGGKNLDLRTVSFIAEEQAINEEKWVDIVGHAANAKMIKTRATSQDVIGDLDALVDAQDEPFGSTSIYAQYRVFKAAAENGIKVMLDGQGADEMLAGYPHYIAARLATLLRSGRIGDAVRFRERIASLPGNRANRLWAQALQYVVPRGLHGLGRTLLGRKVAPDWLNSEWFIEKGVSLDLPYHCSYQNGYMRYQLIESIEKTSLPALLRYEDRNSMHFSIESRVPFLTPSLSEYLVSLPEEWVLDQEGTTKAVFRKALRGIVPDAIMDRKDKIGFQTPEKSWLTELTPWVNTVLRSEAARKFKPLRIDKVQEEWNGVLQGKRVFDFRIWRWLNIIRWAEKNNIECS